MEMFLNRRYILELIEKTYRKTYRDYGKKTPVFQKIAEWEFRSPNLGQK